MNTKKAVTFVSTLAVCLAGTLPLVAEEHKVPKVLQIIAEQVKPGRGAAHTKSESAWVAALRKAGDTSYYLAMTGGGEALYMTPWDSYEAIEKAEKTYDANTALVAEIDRISAQDGELLSGTRAMMAELVPDISYHAEWDTAKMRYFEVTTVRLNPGYGRDFTQLRKQVNEAHDKAKVDERWAIYEVVTGAPAGTYLIIQPHVSLADWDKSEEQHGKDYQDALGDDTRARTRDFQRSAVKSSQTELYEFSPKMSYLSKAFTDRDPDYWTPKPAPAAAKEEKKKP